METADEGQAENPAKSFIYNKTAMLHHAKEIQGELSWDETLDVIVGNDEAPAVDVNDDLKREVAFYNSALSGVKIAKKKLEALKIPYKRPDDYFAEMLKSDAHMARVKDKLIYEQKKITAVEERKKSQAHRKVAKKVQEQKLQQRRDAKKQALDAVNQYKKRKAQNNSKDGADGGKAEDESFDAMLQSQPGWKRARTEGSDGMTRKSRKREAKDRQYGSGGKGRGKASKKNDAKSSRDMKGFSNARNNSDKKRKAGGASRPGKQRRANMRRK